MTAHAAGRARAVEDGRRLVRQACDHEARGQVVFLSCGWSIITLVEPADLVAPAGVRRFLSLSDCAQDFLPRPEFEPWFTNAALARDAAKGLPADAAVVEVGLTQESIEFLRDAYSGPPWLRVGEVIDASRLERALGFDVIGFDADPPLLHSWLCYGFGSDAIPVAGPVSATATHTPAVNALGLLATIDAAEELLRLFDRLPPAKGPVEVPWCVAAVLAA